MICRLITRRPGLETSHAKSRYHPDRHAPVVPHLQRGDVGSVPARSVGSHPATRTLPAASGPPRSGPPLEALKLPIAVDGITLEPDMALIEEGYCGFHLLLPQLESSRDQAAAGAMDRLRVYHPNRLDREFRNGSIEVIFLNPDFGTNPGDNLLPQSGRFFLDTVTLSL